jgi:hypothetical protein
LKSDSVMSCSTKNGTGTKRGSSPANDQQRQSRRQRRPWTTISDLVETDTINLF